MIYQIALQFCFDYYRSSPKSCVSLYFIWAVFINMPLNMGILENVGFFRVIIWDFRAPKLGHL